MANDAAETYQQTMGEFPQKSYTERTPEERDRAWNDFIADVNAVNLDDAVDELFARARLAFRTPDGADADAA